MEQLKRQVKTLEGQVRQVSQILGEQDDRIAALERKTKAAKPVGQLPKSVTAPSRPESGMPWPKK